MTLVAIVSAKGSPGVTTTAAALAALDASQGGDPLLVELDPSGGTTALNAQLPLEPGLLSLSAAARRGLDAGLIDTHSQTTASGAQVLVAPTSPERARAAVTSLALGLAQMLRGRAGLTIIDCGRWDGDELLAPILTAADVVLVLLRPTVAGAEHVHSRLDGLRRVNPVVSVVCVGDHPYPPGEVAAALGVEVSPMVAADERTAELVSSGAPVDRWLARTPLLRSVRSLLDHIAAAQPEGVAI